MANSFVKVNSYWSVDEANLARMLLESEGIQVGLEGANLVAATWGDANAIGGVKLFVPNADADRAREILDAKISTSDFEQAVDSDSVADQAQGSSEWPTEEVHQHPRGNDESTGAAGATHDLRTLKRPLAWLILVPIFLAFVMPLLYIPLVSLFRFFR